MASGVYFNLIHDAWIPVRRLSGACQRIRPAQILDQLKSDPVISFEWARPDFQIACHEFMIGLLATAFPPATTNEWEELWDHPPSVKELDEAFGKLDEAFYLNRPEKCFLQDFSELESSIELVERLLIESPGDNTVKKNKDLFVHRGRMSVLSLPDAAMALYTLQSWAPAGGSGHRTGVRGGGPMVVLVLPCRIDPDCPDKTLPETLWDRLWANTPCGRVVEEQDMPKVFPWLAPTITSDEQGREVGPEDAAVDKRQCWWGMPRRIRFCFGKGEEGDFVTGWKQRPKGMDYTGWIGEPLYDEKGGAGNVIHPLTPRYRVKPDSEWLSLHPKPGGVHYKHWVGLVTVGGNENRLPADNVIAWRSERAVCTGLSPKQSKNVRLLAAGYDMDKAKVRNFLESEMPLPGMGDLALLEQYDNWAERAVNASIMVLKLLKKTITDATPNKRDAANDATFYETIEQQFTELTENDFFNLLMSDKDNQERSEFWRNSMQKSALKIFDSVVPLMPETPLERAAKIVLAKRRLAAMVSGKGKKEGRKLVECLDLPVNN